MCVPAHKQTDPAKAPGQLVFPIPETTLAQYIERKTEEPKRITFKEWYNNSGMIGFTEQFEKAHLVECALERAWLSALKEGKL